jgi:AraC-like DNA-binding protein
VEASSVTRERRVGRPQVRRSRIIADMLALIEAKQGNSLLIEDFCQATSVSERTLRNIFQEFFGVAPMRLVKVRQLLEIRRALLASDPAHDTVAKIAARFGVWDFSLFARKYRALYGESPSKTLRRPPPKSSTAVDATWLAHAARRFAHFEAESRNRGHFRS